MKNKGLRRVFAVISIIAIMICLVGLLVSAFRGERGATLAFLFLLIVVPSVIFIFIRFTDSFTGHGDE